MKRVLVVDDAMFMRRIITDTLKKDNYNVVGEAGNGIQAVELYKELNPNIVLMDITMPEMDGIEAVKNIIEYDKNANIIMCTAMGQDSMVKESVIAGAKDFIVKPFKSEDILTKVSKFI
ncbi:response regulator [Clostridiaceae bacterium HSG29]|nr:response regulator [Clostridiaceae bacterium HSG29]